MPTCSKRLPRVVRFSRRSLATRSNYALEISSGIGALQAMSTH